jgi:type I restriction enzyme S subunit
MTTINELPQGWQWVKLGDVTGIFAGYSFNSDDFFIGKGVKCIKITNVGVKKLIETEEVLPNYFREKYVNFLVKENDLIIALTRPYIEEGLKIAICTNNYNDSLLNQRVAVIRDISKINFIYLYFFMTSDIVLNFYQKKFKTANLQPNLRLCDLTELNIPLPPLTEQQRLANLLTEKLNIIEQAKQAIDAQLKAAEDLTAAYLREVFESEEAK